jgi:hypothetical protein
MSTTTPEQWLDLAERIEKATRADGDLSVAIWAGATSLPATWISNPLIHPTRFSRHTPHPMNLRL